MSAVPAWVGLVIGLIVEILKTFVARRDAIPAAQEAQRRPALRARLQSRVRRYKARKAGLGCAMALALLACGGCGLLGAKVIIVPPGEPVRLLQDVRAKVETIDAAGKPTIGRARIPAGWYCMPDQEGTNSP